MLELGDPRLGPPKLARGPVAGTRWTIVRFAPPGQVNRGRVLWQKRCVVRCACGIERIVTEWSLMNLRSRGCESKRCRIANQGAYMANTDKVLIDRLAKLIEERKRESARHKEELERKEAETLAKIREIDAECASIELTLSLIGGKAKAS